jgi:hypothetical protein
MTDRLFLLPLTAAEVDVALHALVAYAFEVEGSGDPCGEAPRADAIADRLRGLDSLESVVARQRLRWLGIGSYKNRPQG